MMALKTKKPKKAKSPRKEIPEELKDGVFGILKHMATSKKEQSAYWGVLDRLNTSDDDLLLKTDLPNPLAVAGLMTFASYHGKFNFKEPQNRILGFLKSYEEARISKDGRGREGTLRVLESLGKNESSEPIHEIMG